MNKVLNGDRSGEARLREAPVGSRRLLYGGESTVVVGSGVVESWGD